MWTNAILLIAATCLLSFAAASDDPQDNDVAKRGITISDVVKMIQRLTLRFNRMQSRHLYVLRGKDGVDDARGKRGKDGVDDARGKRGKDCKYYGRGRPGTRRLPVRPGARDQQGHSWGGVEYIRWGKTTCPSGADIVYTGRIGGEHYNHYGGGANYVCLPETPKYLHTKPGYQSAAYMYGTEYEVAGTNNLFSKNYLHNHDAPCVACHVTTRNSKLMIPATYTCPAGWTREYYGYLMTEHYGYKNNKQYICVDRDAQVVAGTHANKDGALLYPVEGVCGSLPCLPYVKGLELTCSVCTK